MRNQILCGDSLTILKTLPSESVQTIVTSPPYYGLRDYGVTGQIGLERTPAEYVGKLVEIFREARRVLRKDGTFWLNLGDSYGHGTSTARQPSHTSKKISLEQHEAQGTRHGGHAKQLMMIPARVAIALQDDGWWLRSEIIWFKPSAMPESVQDRPTRAHEQIYLLAKSEHYYYDADAIKEPSLYPDDDRKARAHVAHKSMPTPLIAGMRPGSGTYAYRNKRDVWTVSSPGYPEAHFATFPPKLIEPCILAGTSPQACEICGSPWKRRTEREFVPQQDVRDAAKLAKASNKGMDNFNGWGTAPRGTVNVTTAGWQPTCTCPNHSLAHCIVLDPFMGSGTTALVALKHNRDYCGIELNPEYVQLAQKRISLGPLWEEVESVS